MPWAEGDAYNASTPRLDDLSTHDVLFTPVRPFHQHVWLNERDKGKGCVFIEDGHRIDRIEGQEYLRPFLLRCNWSRWALDGAHRSIGIHAHDKHVTERTRLTQISNVPGMKEIEHAVGKDHRSASGVHDA